jgi:hypothetical protein
MFRAIELLGDEISIPTQNGVGFGDAGHLFASQALANLGQGGALGVAQAQRRRQASPSEFGSPQLDTHSVTEAPGSLNQSRYASSRVHLLFRIPTAYLTLLATSFGFLTIRDHSVDTQEFHGSSPCAPTIVSISYIFFGEIYLEWLAKLGGQLSGHLRRVYSAGFTTLIPRNTYVDLLSECVHRGRSLWKAKGLSAESKMMRL